MLRFDRRDMLQSRWARSTAGMEGAGPTHWVPSTQAFLDLSLAGLGWAMNPECLARPHIAAGQLVELLPGTPIDVMLYWQVTRVGASILSHLTGAVKNEARKALIQMS
jgi:LysR family transcriptional regulator (chromosome initiation inhibitor)